MSGSVPALGTLPLLFGPPKRVKVRLLQRRS
jgi:hypothetical protein